MPDDARPTAGRRAHLQRAVEECLRCPGPQRRPPRGIVFVASIGDVVDVGSCGRCPLEGCPGARGLPEEPVRPLHRRCP